MIELRLRTDLERQYVVLSVHDTATGQRHHMSMPEDQMTPMAVAYMLRNLADKLDPKTPHTD